MKQYNLQTAVERFISNQQWIAEAGGYGFTLRDHMRIAEDATMDELIQVIAESTSDHFITHKDMGDIVRDHYETCSKVFESNADFTSFDEMLRYALAFDIDEELSDIYPNVINIFAYETAMELEVGTEPDGDISAEVCEKLELELAQIHVDCSLLDIKRCVFKFFGKEFND